MVRLTIKKIVLISYFLFFYLFFIKIGLAQNNLAFTTLLVTATIPSKCETKASEPVFVDDDFQSIKIVSDVTVVCNNESKPIIKIISKNIKELIDNNYALHFKKNNGDLIGFIPDSLVRLKTNSSTMLDFEEESFTFKNIFSDKIKKVNFDFPKLSNPKIENAKYSKLQNNPIIFEISY